METLAKEKRKQARLAKLGSNNPICGTCGEKDWRCLELHHVADHGRDEATVTICRNCHRKVSDDQKDHPALSSSADASLDRMGHFMLGLADLLTLIIEKLLEFGHILIAMADAKASKGAAR